MQVFFYELSLKVTGGHRSTFRSEYLAKHVLLKKKFHNSFCHALNYVSVKIYIPILFSYEKL